MPLLMMIIVQCMMMIMIMTVVVGMVVMGISGGCVTVAVVMALNILTASILVRVVLAVKNAVTKGGL